MYLDDDESTVYPEREQHIFNEKLERDGGVFVEPQHGQVDCNQPGNDCAPDDYAEDPYAIDNRTGTVDDANYSMGVELPNAADLHLVPEGRSHLHGKRAPDEEADTEPGTQDAAALWGAQQLLIQEDVGDGVHVPEGLDGERVLGAMGDGEGPEAAEDAAPTSATGDPTTEDRGGFPERER
jgi:hypothetical protein